MWTIHLINNTVYVPLSLADDFNKIGNDNDYGDVVDHNTGKLIFDPDCMEWMDWITNNDTLRNLLIAHKVNGEVGFADLEGDNRGSFWGHRFFGGFYAPLKGKVYWDIKQ